MTKHIKAEWYMNEHNLPDGSYINRSGSVGYIKNGKRHRDDGPAIECANGDKWWYKSGELHREDGPAIEHANGDKEWWIDGKRHRENGPAIENKVWFVNNDGYRTEEAYLEALKIWKMDEAMK